jgi:hypothetical protein
MYYDTNKATMTNKCTSSASQFDGHGGVPEQCRRHCPMRHVQGYSGSHWTPPLGHYLLRIAPVAARATGKQTTINKYTYKAGRFDSHGNAPVVTVCITQWRRFRASLEATIHRHRASIMSNNIKGTWLCQFFLMFFILKTGEKGHGSTLRPLFLMKV